MKKVFFVCHRNTFPYFEDFCESLKEHFEFDYIIYENANNIPGMDSINCFIFLQNIPPVIFTSEYRCNSYLMNTEQVTHPKLLKKLRMISRWGIPILDYSVSNIKLGQISGISNMQCLPYMIKSSDQNSSNDSENARLRKLIKETPKIYDVAFCGNLSKRRHTVFKQLARRLKIVHVNGWKEKRDKQIAQSKILLNIHDNNSFTIFEHLRCDRWIMAGMVVVSEISTAWDEIDLKDLVIVTPYQNIINATCHVSQNIAHFEKKLHQKLDALGPGIIQKRITLINNFLRKNGLPDITDTKVDLTGIETKIEDIKPDK